VSSLLVISCSTDNESLDQSLSSSKASQLSSESEEIPVYGIVSDTDSQNKKREVEYAIDEDSNSRWAAKGAEVNLDLDLEEIYNIDYINISWYKGSQYVYNFEIYSSNDGVAYTKISENRSTGSTTDLETYDLPDAEYRFLRIKLFGPENTGKGNTWNSIYDIEVYGSEVKEEEQEPVSVQNAFITDTSDADTGELRLDLSESLATGMMSVIVNKGETQDAFINLSGTSTSRKNAMIDMRLDDGNGYSFTESGDTVNSIANFPDFFNNEAVEVVITWDATVASGPVVFVTIDGQPVTDGAFVSESQDISAIQNGVKTVQFRLGGNSSLDASGAGMLVDNLKIYDTSSGVPVIVFEDDFESYPLGSSLNPDDASAFNSPYKNNSFQATVQGEGEVVTPVAPSLPVDGFGPASVDVGVITWKNWYLSVPIDRADGSGKATSIYYTDILSNDLTDEEREYFDFNEDGSFNMDAKFTGYTTSGYYDSFASKYCRTELREYWQGNQTTSDNWYMDDAIHELETTLSVEKCEGEGKVYVAQIHGTKGTSLSGTELTGGPATIKVQWYNDNIILEYYTVEGVVDGEWTSASGTVAKATVGNVGNNKFTVRLKTEEGRFYMALYCEATGVDTGYIEYYDYLANGYEYQNYFKTGNYYRHDEDYTSISEVTLYSAITNHTNAE